MALIATVVQCGSYIVDIFRGKTRPHAFSWFVWGLPAGIVFAAQFVSGGGAGSWTTAMTAILCTVIFILSLFYGEKNVTALDMLSLFTALFAIFLWVLVKNPLGSVVLITIVDVVGFVPTIRKSIHKPTEETLTTYVTGGLKWILSLLAMSNLSFTVWFYPAAMVIANWGFAGMLLARRAITSRLLIKF